MKREYIENSTMLQIHKYLRNINARLIRMTPKRAQGGKEAYVILYIINK
jgi:hypothetical protein